MGILIGILIAALAIILLYVIWLVAYPAYTESNRKQEERYIEICQRYRREKAYNEAQKALSDTNLALAKGANPISPSNNTPPIQEEPDISSPTYNNTAHLTPIRPTSLTNQDISDNIDLICRWKRQDDKLCYVVNSIQLNDEELDISLSIVHCDKTYVLENQSICNISIKVHNAQSSLLKQDIICSAIIDGVVFVHPQTSYNVGDVIATIDTSSVLIEEYKEKQKLELEEKRRLEIALRQQEAEMERQRLMLREQEEIRRLAAVEERRQERINWEKKEIADKIKEKHRRRQLEKEVELELIEQGEILKDAKRPPIPRDVRDAVYNRDGGRCVECGSMENLHFDHIIPFSKGGATNIENLQILCQKCNLEKSNKIG